MALNTWWDGKPEQRYWMEISTEEIGQLLQAPKTPEAHWSYELVGQVQPGDRVLHWTSRHPALAGWSAVTGPATTVSQYTWQPRGTAGRKAGPRTTPGWVVPLGGFHAFNPPVTTGELQPLREILMQTRDLLEAEHGGSYFPFYVYGGSQVRAQQAYLVKFPVELFDVIPGIGAARLDSLDDLADGLVEDFQPPKKKAPSGRTTRAQDPKLRAAIERRSLDVAREYYDSLNATDLVELGKPYDIRVVVGGVERHCEVKGSSMLIDTVELTINEVDHGKSYSPVDLVVVDGIEYSRNADGEVTAFGGTLRVWRDWTPEDEALRGMKYAYSLPPND